jgi:hypothetical protein
MPQRCDVECAAARRACGTVGERCPRVKLAAEGPTASRNLTIDLTINLTFASAQHRPGAWRLAAVVRRRESSA